MLRFSVYSPDNALRFLMNGDFERWLDYIGEADLSRAARLARHEDKDSTEKLRGFFTACWLVVFSNKLEDAKRKSFTLLLVGRAGVGKSSTVNTSLGRPVAKVSRYDVGTRAVEEYKPEGSSVHFLVYDTPGLCDDDPDKGNDTRYMNEIKAKVECVDCLLFVTPLTDPRIRPEEVTALKFITEAFGEEVWRRAVIVFTFSDQVKVEHFRNDCVERGVRVNDAIRKAVTSLRRGSVAENHSFNISVPSVPVTNENNTTPDGEPWLGKLYTTVFERFSDNGLLPFLLATVEARPEGTDSHGRAVLSHEEKTRVTQRIVDNAIKPPSSSHQSQTTAHVSAGFIGTITLIGAGVGSTAGPVGTVVGGLAGVAVGVFVWLTRK